MGGVDQTDQQVACYRTRVRQRKWWWPIFNYLFDVTVVNAWYLMRKVHWQACLTSDAIWHCRCWRRTAHRQHKVVVHRCCQVTFAMMASVTGSWKVPRNADARSALRRRCIDARNVTLVCMLTVSSSTMYSKVFEWHKLHDHSKQIVDCCRLWRPATDVQHTGCLVFGECFMSKYRPRPILLLQWINHVCVFVLSKKFY